HGQGILAKGTKSKRIPAGQVISERIPAGAELSHKIEGWKGTAPGGRKLEIDALDRNAGVVIEIKPDNIYSGGLAEAKGYAQIMDNVDPLPPLKLPDGTTVPQRWKAKCITYDGEAVGKLHIHFFPTAEKTPPGTGKD